MNTVTASSVIFACVCLSGSMVELANARTLKGIPVYDKSLDNIIADGVAVDTDKANECFEGRGLGFVLASGNK